MIALTAELLFTPEDRIEQPRVLVDDGVVVDIASCSERELPAGCEELRFPGAAICPGLVDIHIHGAAGRDVMEDDPGALPAVGNLLARHGVTSFVPTTVTAPVDQTLRALQRLANAIECDAGRGARPIGIHLEGPFISQAKRGVHPPQDILAPDLQLLDRFWEAARGHIRVITIAPELDGAPEFIREAARRGICLSLGHSDSTFDSAQSAIAAGARHATHTFNAMRALDHREPGILGAVLADENVSADIIADGIHVAPAVIEVFLKAKGPLNSVLITDAISATGMPDGQYRLGAFDVDVLAGRCTSGGKLAGSVLTLDSAVRNVMEFANLTLAQAVRMASSNPARVLGLPAGRLQVGARADIVILSQDGNVIRTFVAGQ